MQRIAIIGGHGKVALILARELSQAGHAVTSVFRNQAHADDVAATGAMPRVLDLEQASIRTLAELLAGHDALVWSAGAGGGDRARTYAVDRDAAMRAIDAAGLAGTRRFVMVSYFGAGPDHGLDADDPFLPYAEAKAAADDYLRASGLDWTVLGPGALTLEPASGRVDVGRAGGGAGRPTSRGNVARVAAQVLATPSTIGRTIDFVDGNTPIADAIRMDGAPP